MVDKDKIKKIEEFYFKSKEKLFNDEKEILNMHLVEVSVRSMDDRITINRVLFADEAISQIIDMKKVLDEISSNPNYEPENKGFNNYVG